MIFAEEMRKSAAYTRTENGAVTISTTGNACLDLFGSIGSLREADKNRIHTLFAEAYKENPLFATKIVFYARDIREGLGENTELFQKLQSALIEDKVLYDAFVASIESAIKELPTRIDRECAARRIADRIIGREE